MKVKILKQNMTRLAGLLIFANVILATALYLGMGTDDPYFYPIILNFIGASILIMVIAGIANRIKGD